MFVLDYTSRQPIYEQIYNSVIRQAALGVFSINDKLPPVRALASELGINPNTVAKAYSMLERDGLIYSVVGRGSFISEKLTSSLAEKRLAVEGFAQAAENAVKFGADREELIKILDGCFALGGSPDD